MDVVELRVLGPMAAEVDGRGVALGSPQQRAVLAALTMSVGSIVLRSTLVDRLWPEEPPASAGKLVQKYVSGLRGALGADAIVSAGGGYGLAVDATHIDVCRFERAIDAASRRTGNGDSAAALERADLEWRGDPYAGCGDPAFVLRERDRLVRLRLEARLDLLALDIGRGEPGPATATLDRLVTDHPEHERAVALLMRALYSSDRQVDALRAFRRHERHLREELGVDPSPELVALEHRILVHDEELRSSRVEPSRDTGGRGPAPVGSSAADDADDAGDVGESDAPAEPSREEIRPVVAVVVRAPRPDGGPDDLADHDRRLAGDIGEIVGPSGGTVERAADGEVVVVFGIPARDDDAQRAMAVAEEIASARNDARVAVVAGDALVAVAPVVGVIAGRLIERARASIEEIAPGRVAVAPEVASRLDGRVDTPDAPMVGRSNELGVIADAWRRVVADGRLRVADVIGEPGIGKSRLVHESIGQLDPAPARVLEMGFRGFGDGGLFAALRDLLEQLSAGFDEVDTWLASLEFGSDEERAALAAQVAPLFETFAEHGTTASSEWSGPLGRLLEATVHEPTVVVLEDAHWADDAIVAGLDDVVAQVTNRPILVVVTRRPEPRSTELDPLSATERLTLRLGPLTTDEVRRLALAAGHRLPPEVLDLAAERSGGSPLFLLQYIRMLLDRPDAAASGTPPDTVRLVISTRVDHLAEPLHSVIQAAALLSSRIRAAGVAAISGRDESEVAAALKVLARSGLLRPSRRGGSARTPEFDFHHAVVADVVYGRLTRPTRIDLHRRAAGWLESLDEPAIDDVQSAAWHRRQVVDLAQAGHGVVAPDDIDAARVALRRAGDRLLHVDAPSAIRAFDDALELAPAGDVDRADILLQLGVITTDAGDFERATTALSEAAEIYDRGGHDAAAGEALARQARAYWYLGRADRIDELLGRAFERLNRVSPSPAHARAQVIVASQTALRGRAREALELSERAWPVVEEHGSDEDVIRLLHARGHARFDLDDAGGIADLEDALERTIEGRFGRLASQSYNNLAELVWAISGPDSALELASAGLELARDYGFLGQAPWHHAQLGELRLDAGDWDAVVAPDAAPAASTPVVDWMIASLRARIEFWRGDDAASAALDEVLASARVTQERQVLVPMLSAAIDMHARLADPAGAARLGEELIGFAGADAYNRVREAGLAVRGLIAADRADLAGGLLPSQCPSILRRRLMWQTGRAALTEAGGDHDLARRAYVEVESGWEAFPHPFEAAHAAVGVARCAARLGDRDDVEAASARARAHFGRLRADRGLADVASLAS